MQRKNTVLVIRGAPCGRDGGQGDREAQFGRIESGHSESHWGSSPGGAPQSQPLSTLGPQQRSFPYLGWRCPLLTARSQHSEEDMKATFTHKTVPSHVLPAAALPPLSKNHR